MTYKQGLYPIIKKEAIAKGIFDYTLHCPEVADLAEAGQFVHIRAKGFTLRRPISICEIDRKNGTLRLVFEVRGEGTEEISKLNVGELMDLLAPLGKGFTLLSHDKKAVVIGGGIGVPPMLETASHYGKNTTAIIGFRSADAVILSEDFNKTCGEVHITTDDGTKGAKGFVTDVLAEQLKGEKPDIVYACGPTPMLKAVAKLCEQNGVRCQVSLEERMGCGVGACLVCACKVARENGETYKHVCKDGPVFEGSEVIFE